MQPERVVIAANRLPVSAVLDHGAVVLKPSEGGLATGIRPWFERSQTHREAPYRARSTITIYRCSTSVDLVLWLGERGQRHPQHQE